MTDPLVCVCGHEDNDHDPMLGFCEVCRCVVFRLEDDFGDEDEGELDFSHDDVA